MADPINLGDIGTEANSSNVDKLLRTIAADGAQVTLPVIDNNSSNIDKLLMYIIENGGIINRNANKWFSAAGHPKDLVTDAETGDFALNTENGNVFKKQADGNWLYIGNIPKGNGGTWYNGNGAPKDIANSKEGDFYLDKDSSKYYKLEAGQWKEQGNLKGETGQTGTGWTTGTQDPNKAPIIGEQGELYLDTASWNIYKYVNTSWVVQGNIKGPKGDTGASGNVANINSSGTDRFPRYQSAIKANWSEVYPNGGTSGSTPASNTMLKYYKIGEIVYLQGAIKKSTQPSVGEVMFTINDAAYRPKFTRYFTTANAGVENNGTWTNVGNGVISITKAGEVRWHSGNHNCISLDGICFSVNQ